MKFRELLNRAAVTCEAVIGDAPVAGCSADSRTTGPNDCFVAMPSARTDTSDFLSQAVERGATSAIVSSEKAFTEANRLGIAAAYVRPSGHYFNVAIGRFCREAYDDPSTSMQVIGVTGTNGKTTTAWMVRDALNALGRKAAYLGTLGLYYGTVARELSNTTPFPVELWQLLAEVRDAGCTDIVMEASSHALVQRRLAGVSFRAGLFTNLTQDHLDFHGTMEEYADAKKLLFTEYAMASRVPFVGALNIGDPVAESWLPTLPIPITTYGTEDADFNVKVKHVGLRSIHLELPDGTRIETKVGGEFNVSNLTTAAAGLKALGFGEAEIATALGAVTPVPGRFETVGNSDIGVIVDYAHTPDALDKLITSARALKPNRIITVFGCGGDRDRSKRPQMAAVASRLSDISIVTSDNPRTEDPIAIIADVTAGLSLGSVSESVVDRREAIVRAISIAQPGDMVIIAGKGHENYQIIGHTKHPMDDRVIASEALAAR